MGYNGDISYIYISLVTSVNLWYLYLNTIDLLHPFVPLKIASFWSVVITGDILLYVYSGLNHQIIGYGVYTSQTCRKLTTNKNGCLEEILYIYILHLDMAIKMGSICFFPVSYDLMASDVVHIASPMGRSQTISVRRKLVAPVTWYPIWTYMYIYIYMVPSSVSPPPPSPPPWVGSPGSSPPSLLFASYWQHFWGPASYLLGLCSISDYQPRIY